MMVVLAIKALGFYRPDKLSVTFFQCIMVTSKIKHESFYLDQLLFHTKKILVLD